MSRGAMMMISAAAAGILIAGTAAAISVVNATATAPTSNSIELISPAVPVSDTTSTAPSAIPSPLPTVHKGGTRPIPRHPQSIRTSPESVAQLPPATTVTTDAPLPPLPHDHDGDDD